MQNLLKKKYRLLCKSLFMKDLLSYIVLLLVIIPFNVRAVQNDFYGDTISSGEYHILHIRDYTFDELLDEGITTAARQFEVLHIPIQSFRCFIKKCIKGHRFELNKGERRVKKTIFRSIAFSYPSISPQGKPIMLSGLVTVPILTDNKPFRMLIYHRLTASTNKVAPTNNVPVEAVLTADNTICVFPDYYGCGITEGNPLPHTALNYHARCSSECALAALNVVHDLGIELADGFYTWITGYSQGGGYALATHKYIETSLPDSLSQLINLRWSLCGGGIYSPLKLYKTAIETGDMGDTPVVFLQGVRGLFSGHQDQMEGLYIRDLLSDQAVKLGLDSLLQTYDDGFWYLEEKLDGRFKTHSTADYFSPNVLDTSSALFRRLATAFNLDDCAEGWKPKAPIALYHSKRDRCIPFQLASQTQKHFYDTCSYCTITTPFLNFSHAFTYILYLSKILGLREDKLYKKHIQAKKFDMPCLK